MYYKYFKTIALHKWYVAIECFKRGLFIQGLLHDLSKFSFTEFVESARYFYGKGSKYDQAWLHHKGRNKHHWEYWIDFCDAIAKPIPIPKKYIIEMCCDLIGASKAYVKGTYDPTEPLHYFLLNRHKWIMDPESMLYLEMLLRKESLKRG